jgi:hypothetical protein
MLADPFNPQVFHQRWSYLRGYVIMLQYNPFKRMSNNELRELANLIGDQPPHQERFDTYLDKLETARVKLKQQYDFTDEEINSW